MTDIFKDIEQAAKEDQSKKDIDLGFISDMVRQQAALEAKEVGHNAEDIYSYAAGLGYSVADLEGALKMLKKDLFNIKQIQLPELMQEFGLDSVTTSNGAKLEIKSGLTVTVKDTQGLHAYLREQMAGDLIKDTVVITVDSDGVREEISKLLSEVECDFERKESIHSMTLKKYIKDCLGRGVRPPEDVVKVYEYRYANIKF